MPPRCGDAAAGESGERPPEGSKGDRTGRRQRRAPGDGVLVTLRWDTTTFTGPALHKTLDCVSGPAGDGFGREKSNDVCFIVRGDHPAEGPAPAVTPPLGAPEVELTAPEVTPGPGPLTATPINSPVAYTAPIPAPILGGPAGEGPPGTEVGQVAGVGRHPSRLSE
jgi:hypothetical protein